MPQKRQKPEIREIWIPRKYSVLQETTYQNTCNFWWLTFVFFTAICNLALISGNHYIMDWEFFATSAYPGNEANRSRLDSTIESRRHTCFFLNLNVINIYRLGRWLDCNKGWFEPTPLLDLHSTHEYDLHRNPRSCITLWVGDQIFRVLQVEVWRWIPMGDWWPRRNHCEYSREIESFCQRKCII